MQELLESPVLLALLIFLARVADVSMGTVRTIVAFRGYRLLASVLGFLEVVIWLLAAAQVIRDLDAWYLVVAYAGGFATGNYVGIWIEQRLAFGSELVRAVSPSREIRLADALREDGHRVTEIPGFTANRRPVEVLLVVERRRKMRRLLARIHEIDPEAVCTTNDVRTTDPILLPRPPLLARRGGWRGRGLRK